MPERVSVAIERVDSKVLGFKNPHNLSACFILEGVRRSAPAYCICFHKALLCSQVLAELKTSDRNTFIRVLRVMHAKQG